MNSLFGIEIKTNSWVPRDKVIMTDKTGNIVGIIDLETPQTKFKRLLNMGPE